MNNLMQKKHWKNGIVYFVSISIGLVLVFPIVYCFFSAFKSQAEFATFPPKLLPESFFNFNNFLDALNKTPLLRFMFNSFAVATIGSLLRIFLATLSAYAFAFYEFKGKKLLFFMLLGTMMLPSDTLLITNYLTVSKLNLLDTYLGMSITSLVGASQMFMLRQAFKTIPASLRDAALLDGCGDIRFLCHIVFPISAPVFMILTLQSFVSFWNAYLWPLLVTNKTNMRTAQVGITMLTSPTDTNYSLVMAAVFLVLIPSFVLFYILRKSIVKGAVSGGIVG